MKYFAGIDVSLSKVGFTLLDNSKRVIHMQTFHSAEPIKFDRVIEQTHSVISELGKIGLENVEFAAIEEPAWGALQFVGYDLGMAYGLVMTELVRRKVNYIIVNPAKVKSFVSPKKLEGKEDIIEWCKTQGVEFPEKTNKVYLSDMADSYVLARIAQMFSATKGKPEAYEGIPDNQWRVLRGKDSKGRDVGLLDRPDLYRIFQK